MDKEKVQEFVGEVLARNKWINGIYNANDGDVMAVLEYEDMFSKPSFVDNLDELYKYLKHGYTGTFVWKNIVIFNHPYDFGTFVYRMPKYDTYEEHLTMDAIELEDFKDIITKISDGTYWNS